jgi:hypothetical protein
MANHPMLAKPNDLQNDMTSTSSKLVWQCAIALSMISSKAKKTIASWKGKVEYPGS